MDILFLGIDPGTRVAGYGLVSAQGSKLIHIDHGVFEAKSSHLLGARLKSIGEGFEKILSENNVQVMALEKAFVGTNPRSALALGEARGLFLYLANKKSIEVVEVSPTQVKKGITGSGKADKEHLRTLTLAMLGIKSHEKLDATDALAMALYAAQRYSLNQRFGQNTGKELGGL